MQVIFIPGFLIFVTVAAAFVPIREFSAPLAPGVLFRDRETCAIHKKQDECTDSEFSPDLLSTQSF
jgi:hypothetical protein